MSEVKPWVREMTEEVIGGSPFHVGQTVKTDTGKTVKIVSGQYWGRYGISNFWWWKYLRSDGTLEEVTWCGYGYINDKGELITKNNAKKAS